MAARNSYRPPTQPQYIPRRQQNDDYEFNVRDDTHAYRHREVHNPDGTVAREVVYNPAEVVDAIADDDIGSALTSNFGGHTTLEKNNVPDMTLFLVELVTVGEKDGKNLYYMQCKVLGQADPHSDLADLTIKNYRDKSEDFFDFTGLHIGAKVTISAMTTLKRALESGKMTLKKAAGLIFGTLQVEDRNTTQYKGQLALASVFYSPHDLIKMGVMKDGDAKLTDDGFTKLFESYGKKCGEHWSQNCLLNKRKAIFEDMKKQYPTYEGGSSLVRYDILKRWRAEREVNNAAYGALNNPTFGMAPPPEKKQKTRSETIADLEKDFSTNMSPEV